MNKTNLIIDSLIFLAFLIAMEPRFGGVAIHEWLSLGLAVTIVIHLLLHWDWIITVGVKFFKKLWHSSRLKFVVDALLFVDGVAIMLSGILISKAILPALGISVQMDPTWRQLHSLTADLGILLLGVHFALSWKWIVSTIKRYVVDPLVGLFRRSQLEPAPVTVPTDEQH